MIEGSAGGDAGLLPRPLETARRRGVKDGLTRVLEINPQTGRFPGEFKAIIPAQAFGIELVDGTGHGVQVVLLAGGQSREEAFPGQYALDERDTGRVFADAFDRLLVTWSTDPGTVPLRVRLYFGTRVAPADVGSHFGSRSRSLIRGTQEVTNGTPVVIYTDDPAGSPGLGDRFRAYEHHTPFVRLVGFVGGDTVPAALSTVVVEGAYGADASGVPLWFVMYEFTMRDRTDLAGTNREVTKFHHDASGDDNGSLIAGGGIPVPPGFFRVGIRRNQAGSEDYRYALEVRDY